MNAGHATPQQALQAERELVEFLVSTGNYSPEEAQAEADDLKPGGENEYAIFNDPNADVEPPPGLGEDEKCLVLAWWHRGALAMTDNWYYDDGGHPVSR